MQCLDQHHEIRGKLAFQEYAKRYHQPCDIISAVPLSTHCEPSCQNGKVCTAACASSVVFIG